MVAAPPPERTAVSPSFSSAVQTMKAISLKEFEEVIFTLVSPLVAVLIEWMDGLTWDSK